MHNRASHHMYWFNKYTYVYVCLSLCCITSRLLIFFSSLALARLLCMYMNMIFQIYSLPLNYSPQDSRSCTLCRRCRPGIIPMLFYSWTRPPNCWNWRPTDLSAIGCHPNSFVRTKIPLDFCHQCWCSIHGATAHNNEIVCGQTSLRGRCHRRRRQHHHNHRAIASIKPNYSVLPTAKTPYYYERTNGTHPVHKINEMLNETNNFN